MANIRDSHALQISISNETFQIPQIASTPSPVTETSSTEHFFYIPTMPTDTILVTISAIISLYLFLRITTVDLYTLFNRITRYTSRKTCYSTVNILISSGTFCEDFDILHIPLCPAELQLSPLIQPPTSVRLTIPICDSPKLRIFWTDCFLNQTNSLERFVFPSMIVIPRIRAYNLKHLLKRNYNITMFLKHKHIYIPLSTSTPLALLAPITAITTSQNQNCYIDPAKCI